MGRTTYCKVCKGQLQGHDVLVKADICYECYRSKNPKIVKEVQDIKAGYKRRDDELNDASKRAMWKNNILNSEKTRFRVYYVDYGTDGVTYSTEPFNTIAIANAILDNRIANGVDVQAIIVEEKISIREIKPKKKITHKVM